MRQSFWSTPSGIEALAARRMDRQPMYEALHASETVLCGECAEPTDPAFGHYVGTGRAAWFRCDRCFTRAERRYHDAYGDADELTLRLMDGDR